MDRNGRAVIILMDHGISNGSFEGFIDMKGTVDVVINSGAAVVIMRKGLIRCSYCGSGKNGGRRLYGQRLVDGLEVGTCQG